MNKKKIKKYYDKFSDVPSCPSEIFTHLLEKIKFNDKDFKKLTGEIDKVLGITQNEVSFTFYFTPEATPRPRTSKNGHSFYVKTTMDYYKVFKEFKEKYSNIKGVITTPCKFMVLSYFPIPENLNKVEKVLAELNLLRNVSHPDWDNLGKTYSDMVRDHLILDDRLIYDGRSIKQYSAKPRIEIYISYDTDYDSKYNKKKIEGWKNYQELVEGKEDL